MHCDVTWGDICVTSCDIVRCWVDAPIHAMTSFEWRHVIKISGSKVQHTQKPGVPVRVFSGQLIRDGFFRFWGSSERVFRTTYPKWMCFCQIWKIEFPGFQWECFSDNLSELNLEVSDKLSAYHAHWYPGILKKIKILYTTSFKYIG